MDAPRRSRFSLLSHRPGLRFLLLCRRPWLHFVLLGGLAFAATPRSRPEIHLGADALAGLRAEWREAHGRPPSPAEERALVERAIDDAVLLAEAWASGWPERDPVVAERRARIGGFVGAAGGDGGSEAEGARSLGLDRSDPVIRRYLLERMRLAIEGEVPAAAWPAGSPGSHGSRSERLKLHHVHVRSGPEAAGRAAALGERLAVRTPAEVAPMGDPFPEPRTLVATREEIARRMGAGFAAALDADRAGTWQGPIGSAYGLHWVWIEESRAPPKPSAEAQRTRARRDLQARREAHLRQRLDALRQRYRIRVDAPGRPEESPAG